MIITGVIVSLLLTTIVFANDFLSSRIAENEFSSNQQFMLAAGLQIDDIAWTIGRTQTIRFSSKYGNVMFQSSALSYSLEVNSSSGWETVLPDVTTGMIMFNMPISEYNLGNNYFDRIYPSLDGSFLQQGPSASVSHVFAVEKLPMPDGNFTRVAAVSSIRYSDSTIVGPQQSTSTVYYKFYLPALEQSSENPQRSQSITMTGSEITKVIRRDVNQVRITVAFPSGSSGFDSSFFRFDNVQETVNLPAGAVVEFYIGKVILSFGQV